MSVLSKYLLSLDFGHGGGKVLFYDIENHKCISSYEKWSYFSVDGDSFLKEFNPDNFFNIFCNQVKKLIQLHNINPNDIAGISTSSMRHSYVFIDKNGKEVYAGPNTDTRGLYYQDIIEDEVDVDIFNLTGQWPPLLYMPAKLLWFKEEKPSRFEKIDYAMTTGDWLTYKLTGEISTEASLASATMLLNIKNKQWIPEILEILKLDRVNLPEIYNAGDQIGILNNEVSKKMGLKSSIPVSIGGADTQLGLLTLSNFNNSDIGLVAGTSIPVMMSLSKPVFDTDKKIWTHCHSYPDSWVLESNAQMGGLSYQWLKENFKEILSKNDEEIYRFMDEQAKNIPPGSDNVVSSLGSEIFNINELSIIRPSVIKFQQPGHPMNDKPASFAHFIRSNLENICYAIKGNIEQVEKVSNLKSDVLNVTGGMSNSKIWLEILSNVTGKKILSTKIADGTSIGGIICASIGSDLYNNFNDAIKNLVELNDIVIPNNELIDDYNGFYKTWKDLYYKLPDL